MNRQKSRQQVDLQIERVKEIREQLTATTVNLRYDPDEPGFLIIEIPTDVADSHFIHSHLWVDTNGHVAEAMVNQPIYYKTMQDLLEDAASREDN